MTASNRPVPAGMKRQPAWRYLLFVLSAILLLFAGVDHASAHAIALRTEPADSSELETAPTQIRIWFSEAISIDLTQISLVDNQGHSIPVKVVGHGPDPAVPGHVLVTIQLPPLTPSVYNFSWRTISSADLHATSGSIVFGYRSAVTPPSQAPNTAPPQPVEALLRWLALAGFSALSGGLAFLFLGGEGQLRTGLANRPGEEPATRKLLRLAMFGTLVDFAAGLGLLAVQPALMSQTGAAFIWTRILFQTQFGAFWLAAQAVLLIILILLVLRLRVSFKRPQMKRAISTAVAGGILASAVLAAFTSHPATVSNYSPLQILADSVHLLAASLWIGGLMVLVSIAVPLLRRGPVERSQALVVMRNFGWLAVGSVAALVVTGLYLTGQLVASFDALLASLYGQTLLLKTFLVLCTGFFGLLNSASLHARVVAPLRRLLHRPAGWTPFSNLRLGRTVLFEAGLASAVLLLAATLASSQPARGPAFDPPAAAATPSLDQTNYTTQVNDLVVTLSIKPDRPGQNFVSLGVFNSRRPAPAPITQVLARFTPVGAAAPGLNTIADSVGAGQYRVNGLSFQSDGNWTIALTIQRPNLPDASVTIPWTVLPALTADASRPVLVSNQPLAPLLDALSAGLALLVLGLLLGRPAWQIIRRRIGLARADRM